MKKMLLFLVAASVFNCALAQLNGAGYYRVQNKVTERYIRVIDNRGSVNLSTTEADLGALETIKYFDKVVSDPATIIYIQPVSDGYDLKAQGTSSYSIIGYYVKLWANTNGTYYAYAQKGSLSKYLCDENTTYSEGVVLTNSNKTREWYIKPVNQNEGQYFALRPNITVGGDNYTTIYASFPFTLPAEMKAYYIYKVADGQAVYKEVSGGKVPAATPVFVKCKSATVADNKVTVGENSASSVSGNLLKGVYFNNGTKSHNNQVAYNAKTMRILGTMSDGSLGFVTANIDFIPMNTAYLVVPENSPSEIKVVSESEFKPSVTAQSITLSQQSMTMYAGESITLTATVLPADASDKSVNWTSSDNNVATVDSNGVVKAVGYGKATITVTSAVNSAVKATCEVQVYEHCTGVQLSATSVEMYVGDRYALTVQVLPLSKTDGKLVWTSSNEQVVRIESDGNIVAVGYGNSTITVSSATNSSAKATCEVQVYEHCTGVQLSATNVELYVGDRYALTAQALPLSKTDGKLVWSSSNEQVVKIESDGNIVAVGYGNATITVSSVTNSSAKATCEVQVYEHCTGVQLSATNVELYVGDRYALTAQALPLSKTDGKLDWSVANEQVVKLESDGNILAVGVGQTDVTVRSLDGGHVDVCALTVKELSAVEDVIFNGELSYNIYNLNGVELKSLQQGVNIVRFENGMVKKIVMP